MFTDFVNEDIELNSTEFNFIELYLNVQVWVTYLDRLSRLPLYYDAMVRTAFSV